MTREELEDQKHEQEALKNAKEIAKKKSKDKIQKIVWNAVKTAVIPMLLLMAKIIASVILVCVVVSLFTLTIDGNDGETTNTDEELDSVVSTQNIGIYMTSEGLQVTGTQIQDFINNYDSDNTELKQSMLDNADEILQWQNNYGYSALFVITLAFEEKISADNFEDFLDEIDEKTENWKNNGYTTIKEIAEDYVGDDTAVEWANNIENRMQQNALNAGIIIYGEQAISGDGYDSVYISRDGKIYRNYKQIKGSYCTEKWCGSSVIKNDGCSLIAVTVIVSGYRNEEVNPLELAIDKEYSQKGSGMLFGKAFNGEGIGFSVTKPENDYFTEVETEKIKEHVGQGKPAIIRVEYPSDFTGGNHYMTLLDYNSTTDQLYLSNPSNCNEKTGWLDADWVLENCTHFYAIE